MPRRQGVYRLFRPRYDWIMIRDQVGESAYGNAVKQIRVLLYLSGSISLRLSLRSALFSDAKP